MVQLKDILPHKIVAIYTIYSIIPTAHEEEDL